MKESSLKQNKEEGGSLRLAVHYKCLGCKMFTMADRTVERSI